nr:hypothetical protein [Pandoravirus belohorizontensis]
MGMANQKKRQPGPAFPIAPFFSDNTLLPTKEKKRVAATGMGRLVGGAFLFRNAATLKKTLFLMGRPRPSLPPLQKARLVLADRLTDDENTGFLCGFFYLCDL